MNRHSCDKYIYEIFYKKQKKKEIHKHTPSVHKLCLFIHEMVFLDFWIFKNFAP